MTVALNLGHCCEHEASSGKAGAHVFGRSGWEACSLLQWYQVLWKFSFIRIHATSASVKTSGLGVAVVRMPPAPDS